MEFDEVLKNRFSVREFKDQPVENEKLEKITETARMAPSGVNFQPYKIGVFKKCDEFKDLFMQENFHDAPAAIGIAINYDEGFEMPDGNNLADIDVGILASYIALEATNQGLGSCIIASFNKDIAM